MMIFNEVFVTYDDNDDVKEVFVIFDDKVELNELFVTRLFNADVKLLPDMHKSPVIFLSLLIYHNGIY